MPYFLAAAGGSAGLVAATAAVFAPAPSAAAFGAVPSEGAAAVPPATAVAGAGDVVAAVGADVGAFEPNTLDQRFFAQCIAPLLTFLAEAAGFVAFGEAAAAAAAAAAAVAGSFGDATAPGGEAMTDGDFPAVDPSPPAGEGAADGGGAFSGGVKRAAGPFALGAGDTVDPVPPTPVGVTGTRATAALAGETVAAAVAGEATPFMWGAGAGLLTGFSNLATAG